MIDYLLSFTGAFFQSLEYRHQRLKDKSEALSALLDALRCTKKHIRETRVEEFGDTESLDLANKWSKAAMLIRPFDDNFANVLEIKSHYWTGPDEFRRDILNGGVRYTFRMRLESVEREILLIQNRYRQL